MRLVTTGDRVLILGGAPAVFEAACGVMTPSHGEVRVRGAAARDAARVGSVAGAPASLPFPPRWTARQYVTWSARVSGRPRQEALALAEEAMALLKMVSSAGEALVGASTQTRRTVSIAAALATGATSVFLEEPLYGLTEEAGRHFARLVLRALQGRSWAVFAARLPLESPFAMEADEAVVMSGRGVLAQGAPAELAARERCYAIRVTGMVDDFARRAAERGARVTGTGGELMVDLGGLGVSDLLRTALETQTTLLELEPVAHAFS
jgi:ABC-2 type transport system ATP-binding protein